MNFHWIDISSISLYFAFILVFATWYGLILVAGAMVYYYVITYATTRLKDTLSTTVNDNFYLCTITIIRAMFDVCASCS